MEQVSRLLGGEPTQSTLSRWETSEAEIPPLVSEKLLASTKVELPLGELQSLLARARAHNTDFLTILGLAITEYLASRRTGKPTTDYAQAAATASTAALMLNETPAGNNTSTDGHVALPVPASTPAEAKALSTLTADEIAQTVAQVDRATRKRRAAKLGTIGQLHSHGRLKPN